MGDGDYYWGLYRDYFRDPFPHFQLGARECPGVQTSGVKGFVALTSPATPCVRDPKALNPRTLRLPSWYLLGLNMGVSENRGP